MSLLKPGPPLPKVYEQLELMEKIGMIDCGWQVEQLDRYLAGLLERMSAQWIYEGGADGSL